MRICLPILLLLSLATTATARDLFVDNVSGDDYFQGRYAQNFGNDSGPVRTIGRALQIVQAGDRIVLANTGYPYRECLSFSAANHCGNIVQPLVIDGQGATLDGSMIIPHDEWEIFRGPIFRYHPPRGAFQQLFINDKPLKRRELEGPQRGIPALEPLEWCLRDGYIFFRVEEGKVPEDYRLTCGGHQTGITLYHVHDVVVHDLIVQGFQLDGINAHDARNCLLSNVTCRGNGRAGIAVAAATRLTIEDCVSGDNGAAQLFTEGYSHTRVTNSQLVPNTAPAVQSRGGSLLVNGKPWEGK
jgi:hypothetical protein